MSIKLEDFRLESYDERLVLMMALSHYHGRLDCIEPLKKAMEALQIRLAQTQCQPGGCSLCGGGEDD